MSRTPQILTTTTWGLQWHLHLHKHSYSIMQRAKKSVLLLLNNSTAQGDDSLFVLVFLVLIPRLPYLGISPVVFAAAFSTTDPFIILALISWLIRATSWLCIPLCCLYVHVRFGYTFSLNPMTSTLSLILFFKTIKKKKKKGCENPRIS